MTFGVVSETESLRLRIVQMVRGQGRDTAFVRGGKPTSGQPDLKLCEAVNQPEVGGHSAGHYGSNHQGHGIFDKDNDRIPSTQHPTAPSAYSSKSRAAAWLIRRFHRRQDRHTDSGQQTRNVKSSRVTGQENGQTVNHTIDPTRSKSRNLDPIPDDAIRKPEFDHFLISAERKRLLEAHLANVKSDLKSNGTALTTITGEAGNVNVFRGDNNISFDPRKDKPRGVNKLKDIFSPEPVFLKHDRRKGIFSASLENFKKRLQLASNKVGVIEDSKENVGETVNLGYSPLKHVPRPPTQPRDPQVKPNNGKHVRPETGTGNVTTSNAPPEHKSNVKNDGGTNHPETAHNSMRPRSSGKGKLRHEDLQQSSDIARRLRKPLSRIGENEVECCPETHSAKRNKRIGAPAPLTVHNLRVHDSMQSAQERRLRRLQPRPPTQLQLLQQSGDHATTFTPTPGDRMWQWLDEVKLEASPVAVLTLHSGREQMETPMHFKENFEIFV